MDQLIPWIQPLGVGLMAVVMVLMTPRNRSTSLGWDSRGAITEVPPERLRVLLAGVLLWGALEAANGVLSLWRYTLLPGNSPLRWFWLGLFGPSIVVGARAAGNWRVLGGRTRPGAFGRVGLTSLAVFAWLVVLVLLARVSGTGVRINPVAFNLWPGADLLFPGVGVGVLLLSAALLMRPVVRLVSGVGGSVGWILGPATLALAVWVAQMGSVASVMPELRDLPGTLPSQIEVLPVWGVPTVPVLASTTPEGLVEQVPGIPPDAGEALVDAARLSLHAGIGARRARVLWGLGVRRRDDLQDWSPIRLGAAMDASGAPRTPTAWIRAWRR